MHTLEIESNPGEPTIDTNTDKKQDNFTVLLRQ